MDAESEIRPLIGYVCRQLTYVLPVPAGPLIPDGTPGQSLNYSTSKGIYQIIMRVGISMPELRLFDVLRRILTH